MEIPSLPTDNLYKFLALGGIALAVASMYFATKVVFHWTEVDSSLRAEIALEEIDGAETEEEISNLEALTNSLKARTDSLKARISDTQAPTDVATARADLAEQMAASSKLRAAVWSHKRNTALTR